MQGAMYRNLLVRPENSKATADAAAFVDYLRLLPELVQTDAVSFGSAEGIPWLNLTLVMAKEGGWASDCSFIPTFNCVVFTCTDRFENEPYYEDLARQLAGELGWLAVEEGPPDEPLPEPSG